MFAYQVGDEVEVAFKILKSPHTSEIETVYVKGKVIRADEYVIAVSLRRPRKEEEEIWVFPPDTTFPAEA